MKKFNFAVLVVWLMLFALSTYQTSYEPETVLDNTVLAFNLSVEHVCRNCTVLQTPLIAVTDGGEYANSKILPINDNLVTTIILTNTFWFVIFTMFCVNVAFYIGNGAFGRYFAAIRLRVRIPRSKKKPDGNGEDTDAPLVV